MCDDGKEGTEEGYDGGVLLVWWVPHTLGQKMTIESIVDNWLVIFLLKGAGGEHLRSISLEICHKKHINDRDLEEMDGFEFKLGYKYSIHSTFKHFTS